MKKFFMVLGIIFAVLLIIAVIAAAIIIPRGLEFNRAAEAYIQDVLPKIVGHWNDQELLDQADSQLLSTVKSKDDVDRLFLILARLGSLKHLGAPQNTFTSGTLGGGIVLGAYNVTADFENGRATINLRLRREKDGFKIEWFNVKSDGPVQPAHSPPLALTHVTPLCLQA